jgi:acetolactate synthase-1/2/3 large subunit
MKVDSSLLDTAAAKLLLQLKDSGVDYVFANSGTDFPPLIEVFSLASEKHRLPTPLAIFHESVAIGMAHGYYLASGKMAAVIVHVNVGLANCTMGLINAAKSQIPLLLMSGRTPATETSRLGSRVTPIHWGQEMYDQASMVRESVKWEYELRFPEQAETAIARASAIAQSPPHGPVYLSLPREVLAEPVTLSLPVPVTASATLGLPQIDQLEKAAEMLAFAKDPIIVLQRSVPQGNLPELVKFAEDYSIPVVEFWTTANVMPTTHEMHAGFDPGPIVVDADLVVCLGTSVPWTPIDLVNANTKVIAMGADPLDSSTPYRSFRCDLALQSDLGSGLTALSKLLKCRKSRMNIEERRTKQLARRENTTKQADLAITAGQTKSINHAYASRVLSEEAGSDALFFSELGVIGSAMSLTKSGQLYWTPHSGGLGWGVPAALGAKLASPEKTVIATVGDGSYMFANPTACHQVSVTHDLPILTVVFNNGRWQAVQRATLGMYPDGNAAASNVMPLTQLGPSPDYTMIAAAHGAFAEKVKDPIHLRSAVQRALKAVRVDRRQALLEICIS